MDKKVILCPIELSELISTIKDVVREELSAQKQKEQEEKLLSPAETCRLFQPAITRQTLAAWTNAGHLQKHIIGGRTYYKQSEVLQAGKVLKRYKVVSQ